MRGVAIVLTLVLPSACTAEPQELVTAYCNNGTHVVAARDRAETFCGRRGGLHSVKALEGPEPAADSNGSRDSPP